MADNRHVGKIEKNRHISATVSPTGTKFGTMTLVDHFDRSDREISDRK